MPGQSAACSRRPHSCVQRQYAFKKPLSGFSTLTNSKLHSTGLNGVNTLFHIVDTEKAGKRLFQKDTPAPGTAARQPQINCLSRPFGVFPVGKTQKFDLYS
jgi:hypothetical protein